MNASDDPLISMREIAEIAGVTPDTVRSYRRQGRLPPPDEDSIQDRPRWRRSTIDAWMESRPGSGARTDLASPVRIRIGRVIGNGSVRAGAPSPWKEVVLAAGMRPSVQMVSVERLRAPADIATRLDIAAGTPAVRRIRNCLADDAIIQHQIAWYPASIVAGSTLERPDVIRGGVATELTRLGHQPTVIIEEVSARPPTRGEAQLFRLPLRVPVIVVERLARDTGGAPVEFQQIISAADRTVFVYEGSPL